MPLGVGDLLIFYYFAVGALQPGEGGVNCKKKIVNLVYKLSHQLNKNTNPNKISCAEVI